ncbi:MAG: hypothetical protein CBC83_02305 [Flavobacteriales bacterium TMED123]|nr:hypothetical protein [Candidatus Neomarinimicrobiota bacterium]MAJ44514.1 hypothetical protein [Candidatus Neomarinimicrobiota bacterium]OUV73950.1 MAG: hypothetical protein CBC83_04750 [Flavobacteriales bacterium TMED123]OUV75591.1 MAG: hypothetical protein CBC83_02305 [Flavobacteriales bacterium TMED123]|tara:strand:- start:1270 stop:2412 length:1143 start_codon:yes stop_codon:yes gene_type:complete
MGLFGGVGGALAGGFSEGLVKEFKLEDERKEQRKLIQDERDEAQRVRDQARKQKLADRAYAASVLKKKERKAEEEKLEELIEKLQFHYGDKAQAIANKGIGFAGEALAMAGAYRDAGLNPALMVDITTGKLTDIPAGQDGAVPSFITFKPIAEKEKKDHNTFQAALVAANEDILNASTEPQRVAAQERFNSINAAHQKFKQENEDAAASGQLDFSIQTRDAILQTPITNAFKNAGLYKRDINGEITLKFEGNQGQVFSIMDSIITQNEEAFINVTDKPFITKLQGQRTSLNNQAIAYIQNTKNKPEAVFLNTNPAIPKFVPLENAGTTARSEEEIEQGRKSGKYRPNQVVEYVFTNDKGEQDIGYAIITTTGTLLGMGSD